MADGIVDHLFRHQFGKMVSILTRIFGLEHLQLIEDAVQDTFVKATLAWRSGTPENPEAWLTKAAKNRVIDLLRKIQSDKSRSFKLEHGPASMSIGDLFLSHEIEDSQLRMIFTACHPLLKPKDQLALALKTLSGFSQKEIATSLLMKEDAVKKRLTRARKTIAQDSIQFEIPRDKELIPRLLRVQKVLYLLFNQGFHSNLKDQVIRRDLCVEAMRLCKMLLKNEYIVNGETQALFALMCFHMARLNSKVSADGELLDLKRQDRSTWNRELIILGNQMMHRAVAVDQFCSYHYEAAIAAEHIKAQDFESTNWSKIHQWYKALCQIEPHALNLLNLSIVKLKCGLVQKGWDLLKHIDEKQLGQRRYLYYGTKAEYLQEMGEFHEALEQLKHALSIVENKLEHQFLQKKIDRLNDQISNS